MRDVDDVDRFEAGMRRRRTIVWAVIGLLAAAAAGVFVLSALKIDKEIDRRGPNGIEQTRFEDLSPAEQAEIRERLGPELRRLEPELRRRGIESPAMGPE